MQKAFTLAEVIITLANIGLILAKTTPLLIKATKTQIAEPRMECCPCKYDYNYSK